MWYLDRPTTEIGPRRIRETVDRRDRPLMIIADPDLDVVPEEILGRLRKLGQSGKLGVYESTGF